ncbi:SdpI family protein [Clostridium gasigenes]|uniref:SdpI/YhfL protein family protein n=1 Tax=Clostridium gasigenes TaxID=94869 RepID=A0A1H0LS40_9CLOT|nr:SdpI family protein [Clostridium gasigenes]MBB6622402.1 SdpI family protein [Clostridium gasigenes]MBU3131016.1 SdpI family protein [Clostridium gasigenes]SDO70903.1 SdpI/YhfL protein family protein [Clostridium gasigenes]
MLIFALIYTLIMSFTMIGFGLIFIKNPPKEINSTFGYRTKMSSKNNDTWSFAHRYAGKVWLLSGGGNAILFIIVLNIFKNSSVFESIVNTITSIQIGILLLVIPFTEIALKKTFDKDGKRKF